MITQIYHKKNELFKVEYFQDEECTEAFDFKGNEKLYIKLTNGDVTPLCYLHYLIMDTPYSFVRNDVVPKKPTMGNTIKIYTPYIPSFFETRARKANLGCVKTLNDITPNLSKYIQEDNAVLFLSAEDMEKYKDYFPSNHIGLYINDGKNDETFIANNTQSLINGVVDVKKGNTTIFISHGTQSELQKAIEVDKYLWENFGIKPDLFVLNCFVRGLGFLPNTPNVLSYIGETEINCVSEYKFLDTFLNKIITTNSTGILKTEDSTKHLQVIDAKEIFEEYVKENN